MYSPPNSKSETSKFSASNCEEILIFIIEITKPGNTAKMRLDKIESPSHSFSTPSVFPPKLPGKTISNNIPFQSTPILDFQATRTIISSLFEETIFASPPTSRYSPETTTANVCFDCFHKEIRPV